MNLETLWAASLGTVSYLTRQLPEGPRYAWAGRLARITAQRIFPDKWRAVQENLAVINAFSGRQFQTGKVFENFGLILSDFLSRSEVSVRVEGREKAEEAKAKGRGVIFLTSHLGNWELGGHVLGDWGWPVTAVYLPYRSKAMQQFIQKRRPSTMSYLAVGKGAAAGVGRVLERRETVALLADRPFGEDGAPVTLCGKPARLPRGPFLFACRYGAPVIPGFMVQESPGRYRAIIEDPLWPEGKGPEAVQNLLGKMAFILEKYLSQYADQWYCFERVWSGSKN